MAKSTAERSAAHRQRLHERNMIRERVWVHPALTHLLRPILDAVRAYPEGTSQRIAIETALKSRHQAGIDPDGKIVIIDAVIWQNRSPPTTIDEVRQQSLAVTISTRKPSPTRRYKNYELRRFSSGLSPVWLTATKGEIALIKTLADSIAHTGRSASDLRENFAGLEKRPTPPPQSQPIELILARRDKQRSPNTPQTTEQTSATT
jgi:hypothetical protein